MDLLSPPYGDGIHCKPMNTDENPFSPPYGNCTEAWHDSYKAILLSLPHGNDTMDFYYWGIVNLFSPPLRGLYGLDRQQMTSAIVFAPLRGWYH